MVSFAAAAAHLTLPALPDGDEPGPFPLADPRRIRTLLAGAGFGDVRIEAVDEPMWIGKDADDVMSYYLAMPFAQPLIATASAQETAAITGALRPYQRADGVVLRPAAWLVTAHR